MGALQTHLKQRRKVRKEKKIKKEKKKSLSDGNLSYHSSLASGSLGMSWDDVSSSSSFGDSQTSGRAIFSCKERYIPEEDWPYYPPTPSTIFSDCNSSIYLDTDEDNYGDATMPSFDTSARFAFLDGSCSGKPLPKYMGIFGGQGDMYLGGLPGLTNIVAPVPSTQSMISGFISE